MALVADGLPLEPLQPTPQGPSRVRPSDSQRHGQRPRQPAPGRFRLSGRRNRLTSARRPRTDRGQKLPVHTPTLTPHHHHQSLKLTRRSPPHTRIPCQQQVTTPGSPSPLPQLLRRRRRPFSSAYTKTPSPPHLPYAGRSFTTARHAPSSLRTPRTTLTQRRLPRFSSP